jgi:hypothetical protein
MAISSKATAGPEIGFHAEVKREPCTDAATGIPPSFGGINMHFRIALVLAVATSIVTQRIRL